LCCRRRRASLRGPGRASRAESNHGHWGCGKKERGRDFSRFFARCGEGSRSFDPFAMDMRDMWFPWRTRDGKPKNRLSPRLEPGRRVSPLAQPPLLRGSLPPGRGTMLARRTDVGPCVSFEAAFQVRALGQFEGAASLARELGTRPIRFSS